MLPEDVKASFRQEIHERAYKVRYDAAVLSAVSMGSMSVLCSLRMPHSHESSIWFVMAYNVCCRLFLML